MGEARHSAYIVVHGPGHDGTTHVLREGITTFGRLPSNDLILLGDLVSRNHARITFFEGRATLQDLGSHNGCYVNKERVTTKVLRHGDVCRVGNFQVFFHVGEPAGGVQQERTTANEQGEVRRPLVGYPDVTEGPRRSESVLLEELQAAGATNDPATRALRFVLRGADALASARDLASYMDEMLQLALEQTGASLGVYLEGSAGEEARIVVARSPEGPVERPHVAGSVVRWVIGKAFAVNTEDVGHDVRFEDSPSRVAGQLAVLCVPFGDEHETRGALYLSRPAPAFTETEQDALTAVAYLALRGAGRWSQPTAGRRNLGRLFSEGAAAAAELARVLKPGGRLVLVDIAFPRDGNRRGTALVQWFWKPFGDLVR
ncbi:MAG: FHA domain-containing protein, partial [Myxococcales bacterium]|nr:FHA domain-containing protein [Myxococcales bacterium]